MFKLLTHLKLKAMKIKFKGVEELVRDCVMELATQDALAALMEPARKKVVNLLEILTEEKILVLFLVVLKLVVDVELDVQAVLTVVVALVRDVQVVINLVTLDAMDAQGVLMIV